MKRTQTQEAAGGLADVLVALPFDLSVEEDISEDVDLLVVGADGGRLSIEVKSLRSPAPLRRRSSGSP